MKVTHDAYLEQKGYFNGKVGNELLDVVGILRGERETQYLSFLYGGVNFLP